MSIATRLKSTFRAAMQHGDKAATLSNEIDVATFKLDGRKLTADVIGAVTGGNIELTIEGASTLTLDLKDPDGKLLDSFLFRQTVRLIAADIRWELVKVTKNGDGLSLTFEDYIVALLRRKNKHKKVARNKQTRAQFIRSQVREVRAVDITFVCPAVNVRQPIDRSSKAKHRIDRKASRDRGLSGSSKLKIKGQRADKNQLQNLERVLDVADSVNASTRATLALIMACIQESVCRNLAGGDRDSRGILQVRDSTARSLRIDNRDVEQCAHTFLKRGFFGNGGAIAVAKAHKDYNPGQVAQAVQGSAHPTYYAQWQKEAEAILEAYGIDTSKSRVGRKSTSGEKAKYEFSRGKPGGPKGEDAWDCTGRLADEVGWRRFVVGHHFYYISEEDLIQSKPRMHLSERHSGVDWIDFDIDAGRDVDQATVSCRSSIWQAPPGTVVELVDAGIADGRWLVSRITRDLFSTDCSIEIRRGKSLLAEKDEPAASASITSQSSKRSSGNDEEMLRPVASGPVTSKFGRRSAPKAGASTNHDGIDYGVPIGTTVRAALSGTVEVAGANGGYGSYVQLRHKKGLTTFYGHLSKISVKKGQRVTRGDTIAKSGNSGTSTGPHLHFGVHKGGKPVDPEEYL